MNYENLIGRAYDPITANCFTLFRDLYKQEFDIVTPHYAVPNDWNPEKLDLIGSLYKEVGMEKVDTWDLRPGDVLATAIGSTNPNHLVIYVGDNKIIQHKLNLLSTEEAWRPFWKMVTCYVLRHPDVPDLTPVLPDVTIEELLKSQQISG